MSTERSGGGREKGRGELGVVSCVISRRKVSVFCKIVQKQGYLLQNVLEMVSKRYYFADMNELRVTDGSQQKPKIPEFAETKEYQLLLSRMVEKASIGERLVISEFQREVDIPLRTLYGWLRHDHTKREIDNYIESMVTQDKTSIYQTVVENKANPHFSRLFLDYYERRTPGKGQNVGNITINFGFFGAEKPQTDPIENAEVIDIVDDSADE